MRNYESQRANKGKADWDRRYQSAHMLCIKNGLSFYGLIDRPDGTIETDIDTIEAIVNDAVSALDNERPDDVRQPSASFTRRNATPEARLLAELDSIPY